MKKLGKKKFDLVQTVEAYTSCIGVGSCNCGASYNSFHSINNIVFEGVHAELN